MKKWILILFLIIVNSIMIISVFYTTRSDSVDKYKSKDDIDKVFYDEINDKEYYENIKLIRQEKGRTLFSVKTNLFGLDTNGIYIVSKDVIRNSPTTNINQIWDLGALEFDEILLKRPLNISSKWSDNSGKEYEIIGFEKIKIMGDTFDSVLVSCPRYKGVEIKYFVKGLGIVRIKNDYQDIVLKTFTFVSNN